MDVPKSTKKSKLPKEGSSTNNEFNSKFNNINQQNVSKTTNVNTPQIQPVAGQYAKANKTVDPNLIASGIGLAASGLSALNANNASVAEYGTNEYFDKQAQKNATNDAIASGVTSAASAVVPYAPALLELQKQLGETIDPKDAYGVSKSGNKWAIGISDMLNPKSRSKSYKDRRNEGDSIGEALAKGLPAIGGIYNEAENIKQRNALKTEYNDTLAKQQGEITNTEIQANIDDAINKRNAGITDYVDKFSPTKFEDKSLKLDDTSVADARVNQLNNMFDVEGRMKNAAKDIKDGVKSFGKKNNFASKYFAKGGEIKGAGTAKSDSIKAKVEEGAFVVPAENKQKAKEMKEELLDSPAHEKAELKHPNGIEVKLSNGEYLLSKEEKEKLESMGINLYEELAPESDDLKETEEVKELAKGGVAGGDDDFVKAELARIEAERKADAKKMAEAQAKAKADKAKYEVRAKAYQLKVQQVKEQKEADAKYKKAAAELEDLKKSYTNMTAEQKKRMDYENPNAKYVGASSRPTTEQNRVRQEEMLKKIADKEAELNEVKTKLDYASNEGNYLNSETLYGVKTPNANKATAGNVNYYTGRNEPAVTTPVTTAQATTTTPVGAKKNAYTARPTVKTEVNALGQPKITYDPIVAPDVNTGEMAALTKDTQGYVPQDIQVTSGDYFNPAATTTTTPSPAVTDDFAAKKGMNVDWANLADKAISYGIPLAQTAIGFNNLKKAGDRPVDKLDPTFLSALNKTQDIQSEAELAARYGLSQDQLAFLNMQNVNDTNTARANARNIAGGNAAAAFNLERAAANDSYGRALQSRVLDADLKLQKQQIAADRQGAVNSMAAQKQNQNRLLFGDAMNTWQQKTQNAAATANTGMTNFLDTYNADKRMKNYNELMKQANQYGG